MTTDLSLGPVVVQLLKGVIERDQHPRLWEDLYALRAAAIAYLEVIGLSLVVDEIEGFAFVRQREAPEDDATPIPRLVTRRPLSYPVSLLCVLLRKKLVESDAAGGTPRVILARDEVVEMLRVFLPTRANEAKLVDKVDQHLAKLQEMGFIRELKGQPGTYEVRRLLRAWLDADALAAYDETLRMYRDHAAREL